MPPTKFALIIKLLVVVVIIPSRGVIIKVVFNLASVVVVQRECTHTAKERRALSYKSGVFCFGGLVLQKKFKKKMPRVFRVYMKP